MSTSLTFIVKALGGGHFFLSSMRLNKAFDAQNGTAKVWTVGPMMTIDSWSHAPAFHIVMTLLRSRVKVSCVMAV